LLNNAFWQRRPHARQAAHPPALNRDSQGRCFSPDLESGKPIFDPAQLTTFPEGSTMIRFPCSFCHHTLKAPDNKAGATVVCRRCQRLTVVPTSNSVPADTPSDSEAEPAGTSRPLSATPLGRAGALPWGLNPWRCLVGLVAGVGVLSLLLAISAPALHFSEPAAATARQWAMVGVPACLVLLFVLLHGHGTICPACGRWWARAEGETESLGREGFEKDGVPWVRATRRTTYACKHCRHTWSATYTDEYKGTVRRRPNAAEE
jgi:hypothetical protein